MTSRALYFPRENGTPHPKPIALPKMPYEVEMFNAEADWDPRRGHTGKGKYYQLSPERRFAVSNGYTDDNRVRNIESLIREPHRMTSKYCSMNGRFLQCKFDFELTQTDRENDAKEMRAGTMQYRRNGITIDWPYEMFYGDLIGNLLLEDVELKKQYIKEQQIQTVKDFLKETIGPNKSALYAPPGIYGEKGGLLYRSAEKKAAATMKQGGKRKTKRMKKTRRRSH